MPKHTFEELIDKMGESRKKFTKLLENADKIPLEQLRKDAFGNFREILYKSPDDLYTKTGGHNDISLYTAAVQLQYFISLNASAALCIYITRLENEFPKSKNTKKKQLLSLEAKKAIAEQVKKEIAKYKKKKAITSRIES